DLFISLTDSDEINLVVGLIAKEYGVKTVAISLIKTNYKKEVLKNESEILQSLPKQSKLSLLPRE
ncbi:MAG: hypothetical protein PHN22_04430, partial [Candidatus ainarchaeum sp.]|nr:hypothetical protein [Candidatus ainarchaeum sp.]